MPARELRVGDLVLDNDENDQWVVRVLTCPKDGRVTVQPVCRGPDDGFSPFVIPTWTLAQTWDAAVTGLTLLENAELAEFVVALG